MTKDDNITIFASKSRYKLYILEKELWELPEFLGKWLYAHNLAVRIFENISILSVSLQDKEMVRKNDNSLL